MSAHQSRAVLEALAGRDSAFVRTPKTGGRPARYRAAVSWACGVELAVGAYLLAGAVGAASARAFSTLAFLLIFAAGFVYVGLASLRGRRD
jgi:hypothetical protein